MDLFYTNCENFEGKNLHEKQHNAGRYLVKHVAENVYKLQDQEIEIINKKPQFKQADLHFSISHCNKYVIVVFDKNEVGIDIEEIKLREYKNIAKRMDFELKENSLNGFYEAWTLFEAKYKLQKEAKNTKTIDFMEEYKISIASAEATEIELNIFKL